MGRRSRPEVPFYCSNRRVVERSPIRSRGAGVSELTKRSPQVATEDSDVGGVYQRQRGTLKRTRGRTLIDMSATLSAADQQT
jgi:hypothetical protein